MNKLKEYEAITLSNDEYGALLKNHKHAACSCYGRSHGLLLIRIKEWSDGFTTTLSVQTIDDDSIVLLGPIETKEKASKRMKILLSAAESWEGWVPTEEQVHEVAINARCYWNK